MGITQAAGNLFLSYATADRERALAIAGALETAGVPVWIDRRGIAGGDLSLTFLVGNGVDPERMRLARIELPNFRSALSWLESTGDAATYKSIMGNLGFTWSFVDMQETQQLYRRAPDNLDSTEPLIDAKFLAGWLNADKAWFDSSGLLDDTFRRLQEMCEANGYTFVGAFAAHEWSNAHIAHRDWQTADQSLARARRLWQSVPDPQFEALTILGQGAVAFYQELFEQAEARFREALAASQKLGNPLTVAMCENWLSLSDTAQGRQREGAAHSLRALSAVRETEMVTVQAGWLGSAAWIVSRSDSQQCWTFPEARRVLRTVGYNLNMVLPDVTMLPELPPCTAVRTSGVPVTLDSLITALESGLLAIAQAETSDS